MLPSRQSGPFTAVWTRSGTRRERAFHRYALCIKIESEKELTVQYTRVDTTQAQLAIATTIIS